MTDRQRTMADFPVFTRTGDLRNEVERIARELRKDLAAAGVHKMIYVARANQTVVMVTERGAPIAQELRRRGWEEPRDV